MFAAYVIVTIVTIVAIAANTFSGVAAIVHFKPILPGMARAGVPESWLTFPIGTLKTAGAAGLLLGLTSASSRISAGARRSTARSRRRSYRGTIAAAWPPRWITSYGSSGLGSGSLPDSCFRLRNWPKVSRTSGLSWMRVGGASAAWARPACLNIV